MALSLSSPFHFCIFARIFREKVNFNLRFFPFGFSLSGIEPFRSFVLIFLFFNYGSSSLNRPSYFKSRVLLKKSRRPSFLRPSVCSPLGLTNFYFLSYPQLRSLKLADCVSSPHAPDPAWKLSRSKFLSICLLCIFYSINSLYNTAYSSWFPPPFSLFYSVSTQIAE